ncbi:MAG TPA: epimerase, partial [Clostridia bacterium]|nr:epimerase [Clostridia bacterium]
MKKALVLGGTGAMGVYLVPELAGMGYEVHSVSIDDVASDNRDIRQIKANAKDVDFLTQQLQGKYDVIVDFMIYTPAEFQSRLDLLLGNTAHYFFLSSYRVYADKEIPTLETSPRLLDVAENAEYLAHRDTEY